MSNVNQIEIAKQTTIEKGWQFVVQVGSAEFNVELEKVYWQELTAESVKPAELIKQSFIFLLDREPVTSILSSFNTKVIAQYFPEYAESMKKQFIS